MRIAGRFLLIAALAALAFWLRGRGASTATSSPEAAVNAWFAAAARGDDRGCLALAGGDYRTGLESARSQQGVEAFRASLRASLAGLRGLAVSSAAGPSVAVERVVEAELVFAGRNEVQRIALAPRGTGWVIVRTEAARGNRPPIAYGTPVTE